MTYITIYNQNQFTKTGKLKKTAKHEYTNQWENGINAGKEADNLKACGYHDFRSSYFFTHIIAKNKDGQDVRIFQDVYINGNKFMTSPKELLIHLV